MSKAGSHDYHQKDRAAPERDPNDWYIEPASCVEQLFKRHTFEGPVYDPCAGSGTIPNVAKRCGYAAIGTDLVERGFPGILGGLDFVGPQENVFAKMASTIVMNPPFGKGRMARAFIARALAFDAVVVCALLPAPLMFGRKTWQMYAGAPPSFMHPIIPRPSMPPGKLLLAGQIEAEGGKEDYFWAVWDRRLPAVNWPTIEPLVGPPRPRRVRSAK